VKLLDTSVAIDHLRGSPAVDLLTDLLEAEGSNLCMAARTGCTVDFYTGRQRSAGRISDCSRDRGSQTRQDPRSTPSGRRGGHLCADKATLNHAGWDDSFAWRCSRHHAAPVIDRGAGPPVLRVCGNAATRFSRSLHGR